MDKTREIMARVSDFVNFQEEYRQDVLDGLKVPASAKNYIEALEIELAAEQETHLEMARVLDRVKDRLLDEIYERK